MHQECPDIDLYVYFVCAPALPSRDPSFSLSRCPVLRSPLFLSPPRCLSSSIPSSDALSSQLHIGSACSVPECTCPTLPGRHPGAKPPPPPFDPSLPRVLFLFLELPASVGAIDALHRVTKLEAKRKVLKYPTELLNVSSYVSRVILFFSHPLPVCARGDRLFVNAAPDAIPEKGITGGFSVDKVR